MAAKIVVPDSVADPLGYYLNNVSKTRDLLEACVRHGVQHFVFSSSAAVYGTPEKNPVSEDAQPVPLSPYGTTKLMCEQMLADVEVAHGMKYICMRYFNVAGADPLGRSGQVGDKSTHLIKVATEAALGKRAGMLIYGTDYPTPDGTCVRDYVHVSDLADTHCAALAHLQAGNDSNVFNCGYGRGFSVREVINSVKKVSGVDFKVEEAPARAGDPAALVADVSRLNKVLKQKPRFNDLETIVTHALAWGRKL
jgi:UDP-glucose 4-epimerase